ncbi:hypothetical protein ASF53_15210 [Methylobacterium sp. Leaf123]|uniref:hypothetical protein n=1 Tax=Methylobacterium sp. Leaf123 TaxID=1736264 RepID=UPI0006FDE0A6|nr:hypothetical protein [Methylobacterium sp. Leaf123]KQQ12012.1 hypothetical protein ASF53_15210 [Methylobacterium sp. Leaf123]
MPVAAMRYRPLNEGPPAVPPVPGGPLVGVPPITAPGVPPTTAGLFGVPTGAPAVLGPGTGCEPVAEAFGLGGEGGVSAPV